MRLRANALRYFCLVPYVVAFGGASEMFSSLPLCRVRWVGASGRLVFEAYTNPEHVPHWMLGPEGWTMPICEEITPPERLVNTESWGGDWPETLNTLVLSEKDGKTTISQTILYPSKEARDAALKTGMKDGASVSFDRLEDYVRTIA